MPSRSAAARIATISAWAVGSQPSRMRLRPEAKVSPPRVTTAPTGTSPAQAPKFNLKVKDVDVGTTTTNVNVPAIEMKTKQVEVPSISVTDGEDSRANAQ